MTANSGDNDGYEVTPGNACASDGLLAHDNSSGTTAVAACADAGKDRHVFWNYGVAISTGATINGIEVRLDASANSSANSPSICVELSWDGGTSWGTPLSTSVLGSGVTTFLFGSGTDTWGRAWTPAELADANFRVRLTDMAGDSSQGFALDWDAVSVTYTP